MSWGQCFNSSEGHRSSQETVPEHGTVLSSSAEIHHTHTKCRTFNLSEGHPASQETVPEHGTLRTNWVAAQRKTPHNIGPHTYTYTYTLLRGCHRRRVGAVAGGELRGQLLPTDTPHTKRYWAAAQRKTPHNVRTTYIHIHIHTHTTPWLPTQASGSNAIQQRRTPGPIKLH